ncbi:hypothetical protein ACXU4B_12685 [Dyella soli]|uniref:Uncharacterized protein n=1 Tax=Dyella soli TaxID=522319 RepID=A0A4R0YMJ1_9GAMM|nr:hypothetical protein [Dyella soli]TCI06999.1 hypothetical protein EZM97_30755 [Dyella soli]
MNQPPKPLSLANIHDVYSGVVDKREREPEVASPVYKTTNRFSRESSHTGVAPAKPLAPGTRYRR